MNRSLMVIFVMGVIAMVMLTVFGSFFVGKVGGAENVLDLRKDIRSVFGGLMTDPESLDVKVTSEDGQPGLLVSYRADPALVRHPKAMDYQMRRVANFILSDRRWSDRLSWVRLRLAAGTGRTAERRFENRAYRPPEE